MHTERVQARATRCARQPFRSFCREPFIVFAIAVFGMSLAVADATPAKTVFNIEAQAARQSLTLYARQAQVQLGFASDIVDDILTNPVKGEYENAQALELLLKGTGLEAEHGESGVIIRRVPKRLVTSGIEEPAPDLAETNSLQLTQATAQGVSQDSTTSAGNNGSEESEETAKNLEEIVVTGSRIRGAQSASPLVTINRDDIDHSGYATVAEVLQSLPQNFSGGPNEDTGAAEPSNITSGSAVNLRGLGTGSTLLLVNGRRQAPSGRFGGFVDVSSIPLTAIDRVEVLTDGASAIYGADAVGGVVNIILRTDFDGTETRLRLSPDIGNDQEAFQFGQVYGTAWSTGNLLAAYEFNSRDALANEDRPYLASSDLRPLGGDDFRDARSQPGNIINTITGERFAIPLGQDGRSLEFGDLVTTTPNLGNHFALADALPEQKQHSIFLTLNQEIGQQLEVFAEARYRKRSFERVSSPIRSTLQVPRSNAFVDDALLEAVNGVPVSERPFLFVEYSFEDDLGPLIGKGDATSLEGVLGGNASIGSTWELELFAATSSEENEALVSNDINTSALNSALLDSDPATAFNPFGDGSNTSLGTVNSVRTFNFQNMKSDLTTINIITDGSLTSLPGGELKLAFGADHREGDLEFRLQAPPVDTSVSDRDLGRRVTAVFAELFVPVVGPGNAITFVRQFDVSAAARYEDYSDFGTTTNPKIGLLWSPAAGVTVRSTFGTSFRAPDLEDLRPLEQAVISTLDDPNAPTGQTRTLIRVGNNTELTEETANIWTLGLDIQPVFLKQLRLSMNYFDIEYEDRISRPDSFRNVHQERYRGAVNSNPTQAELDAVCLSPNFFGDAATCTIDLVEALADARLRNIAITNVVGIDFSASYDLETSIGSWTFGVDGTRFRKYSEAFSASALTFDIKNTIGNPIDLRARAKASWSHQNLGASAFINFANSYVDNVSDPERKIDSHTTVDLQLMYDSGPGRDLYSNWVISLSILNLFNEDPPFANTSFGGYDRANADPARRQAVLQVRKSW